MCGASVAVDAAMLASTVDVDSRVKADIRTIVVGNDRLRVILEVGGEIRWERIVIGANIDFRIGVLMDGIESVRRVETCTSGA